MRWWHGSVVRMSVFGWRTFPELRLIYGWHVNTLRVKERKGSGTCIAPIVSHSTIMRSDVDHTVTCKYTTSTKPTQLSSLQGSEMSSNPCN